MVTISKKTYVPVQNRGVPSTHYEICDGDTKIGTLSAFASNVGEHPYTNKPDKDIFYLGAFMIYREHRRKGYGRQILRKVKEDYKGKVLVLDAHAFDGLLQEDLTNFYASEGFKFINEKEKNKAEGKAQRMFIEL